MATKSEIGIWGEDIAAEQLLCDGFAIVGRRVRPNRHDEIDIIARKKDLLVFVEVKTRASEAFGRPAAAVGRAKQRALCRAAASYLRGLHYPNAIYRFDVIEVIGSPEIASPKVRHIIDAFRFPLRYRFARKQGKNRIFNFGNFFHQLSNLLGFSGRFSGRGK